MPDPEIQIVQKEVLSAVVQLRPDADVSSIVGSISVEEVSDPELGTYLQISDFECMPVSHFISKGEIAVALLKSVDQRAKEKGIGVRVLATIPSVGDTPASVDFATAMTFQELGFKIAAGMSAGRHVGLGRRPSLDGLRQLDGLILTRGLGFTINLQAALAGTSN